ncbi:MAG: ferrous iron transporter B [Lentisphaeria bacterium]|jgi:ferrous iron transport protein B|nr:ferrous iron transporter B [Lentisphaeria bacterium]MDP7742620.1 ferrous iron transporter B [Lentisphaeria bacterium]
MSESNGPAVTELPAPVTGKALLPIAIVGNPNVGKTSVFNRLTNLFAKTANFSGTTVERRSGTVEFDDRTLQIVDLPGLYSLDAQSPDERVAKSFLGGTLDDSKPPAGILVVVDATNLERSLFVAGQILELRLPTIIAVNMMDLAEQQSLQIDCSRIAAELGCDVVAISARTGAGFEQLRALLGNFTTAGTLDTLAAAPCESCTSCPYAHGHRWAANLAQQATHRGGADSQPGLDRTDAVLTHPVVGPLVFAGIMLFVFSLVFWLAQFPMELLDMAFGSLAGILARWLPEGDFQSLLTDGVIGGVGGVLVFLPQICILFFALAVLEDSGYLSRAVVVVDRWMRSVGLPGQAFVPLLAAHACAIPAIMSTKVIENRRDRLAAILVIPLMTCSARLPVYTLIAAMLFPRDPIYAALLFAGAYALGMVAAFAMACLLRLTILPGKASPLILDLPPFRTPSLRNSLRQAFDRGWIFVRDAGTIILLISIGIWFLSTFPKLPDAQFAAQLESVAVDQPQPATPEEEANLRLRLAQEHALIGRGGKFVEPVFRPLGFDWKTSVGVLTSFAAREVVVSTLSVLYGMGEQDAENPSLHDRLSSATREGGSRVFDTATCVSLLVFFVLAMQCMPTQAVTRKETGSWKWAFFQFGYMSVLAYGGAFAARQAVLALGF